MNNLVYDEILGDCIKYTCKLSNSYIIFKITKDYISYFNDLLDWNNLKIVLNLMKISFEDLKKFNINKFRYSLNIDELQFINLEKWNIIEKTNSDVLLECDLNNAFNNVVEGFLT
jgi:hypothetical protein